MSDNLVFSDDKRDPIVFVVVRNEIERMKIFFDHYRKLGIHQFVVLDNGSDDGTLEFVMNQNDTKVYQTLNPYQTEKRISWLEKLLVLNGMNRWCIVVDSDEMLLIHCLVSNVYVAECIPGLEEVFSEFIKQLPVVRLETSNKKLQEFLISNFKVNYQCEQAVFPEEGNSCLKLEAIRKEDLDFVAESYGLKDYIYQLFQRQRLFGYYENQILIGYVAFHIDETLGALYVKPEFRHKGYGKKIMEAAFMLYKKTFPGKLIYAQILSDNEYSIKLHEKLGCTFSVPVYWVYDEEFCYS